MCQSYQRYYGITLCLEHKKAQNLKRLSRCAVLCLLRRFNYPYTTKALSIESEQKLNCADNAGWGSDVWAQGFQFPSLWKIKTRSCKALQGFILYIPKHLPPHKRCFCQLNEPCTIAHSTIQQENPFICCAWKAWSHRPPLIFWPMPLGYRLQPS